MLFQSSFSAFKVHTLTHFFSVVCTLIKRMAFSTSMLLTTSNLTGFASLTVIRALKAFAITLC